jgi:hypothetical protein
MPPPGITWLDWDDEKRWAFAALPQICQNLLAAGFTINDVTSPYTIDYNCIAYAAKDETQPWWPMPLSNPARYYHWPEGLPREDPATVGNFLNAFGRLGFRQCNDGRHEQGYEKVAIYVKPNDEPTHMARELGDGVWFSKLGDYQDIRQHSVDAVEMVAYGEARYFMRKRLDGYGIWGKLKKLLLNLSGLRT